MHVSNGEVADEAVRGFNTDPNPTFNLAYMIAPQAPGGGFTASLMLSDQRTRPIEFACAMPIRPTTLQRLVYGSTLVEHVMVDVIAKKLLSGLAGRPTVLFVDNRSLLTIRRIVDYPVALLTPLPPNERGSSTLSVVEYYVPEDRSNDRDIVGRLIGQLDPSIDLLEPFTRLTEALKEVLKAGS